MPDFAIAMPIPPEKFARWQDTLESFTGERSAEYDASRRRMGAERERIWLQRTPQGYLEIVVIEAVDLDLLFQRMATSQDPFDVDFRAFLLDVYGIDLTQQQPDPPRLIMDWTASPTSTPV